MTVSFVHCITICDLCLADNPGDGRYFCGVSDCAVLPPGRLCRTEEAACHSTGYHGQIFPSPYRQTGRLHTDTDI